MQWMKKLIQVEEAIRNPASLACLAATWGTRRFHGGGQRSDSPGHATIGLRRHGPMVNRTAAPYGVSGSTKPSISAPVRLLRRTWQLNPQSQFILRAGVR